MSEAAAAIIEMELGRATAEARLRTALQLLSELPGVPTHGYLLAWLSLALSTQASSSAEAIRTAEEVLTRYEKSAAFSGLAQLALAKAQVFMGALDAAESAARAALGLLAATPPLQLGAHAQFVQVLLARGNLRQAAHAANAAMAQLERLDGRGWMDLAVRLAAIEVELAEGATQSARTDLRAALTILYARAEQIPDATWRQSYRENVVENARLIELERLCGSALTG